MEFKKSWLQWKVDASEHFEHRRWLEAMNCYTYAIRRNPDEADSYLKRALCEVQLGKIRLAREDAESAVRLNPENVQCYCVLSECLVSMKLFPEALFACEVGLKLKPREPELLVRRRRCEEEKFANSAESLMGPGPKERSDYANIFDKFDKLVEVNRPSSSNQRRVAQDVSASKIWFERAAQRGHQRTPDGFEFTRVPFSISLLPPTSLLEESVFDEWDRSMKAKVREGYPTVKLYFKARAKSTEALNLLQQHKFAESFQKLRESWRMWDTNICDRRPFVEAARQQLRKDPDDHAALYVVAVSAPQLVGSDPFPLLLRCVQLDPSIPDYHYHLSLRYTLEENGKLALESCERAIQFLEHPEWLYARAIIKIHPGTSEDPSGDGIEAYQRFLSNAPSDHSRVPQAYYSLGFFCQNHDEFKALALYWKGVEADSPSVRLPCFQPVGNLPTKYSLISFLKRRNLWPGVQTPNAGDRMCATCTRSGLFPACSGCKKVRYCSRKCQKNNWCFHKRSCAK